MRVWLIINVMRPCSGFHHCVVIDLIHFVDVSQLLQNHGLKNRDQVQSQLPKLLQIFLVMSVLFGSQSLYYQVNKISRCLKQEGSAWLYSYGLRLQK